MIAGKNIYKICLFSAIFLALTGTAWAGFNYDSSNNYFLLDSVLKSGGDYILVGNAFDRVLKTETGSTSAFFGVSNNLIFLNTDSEFCTILNQTDTACGLGSRQIRKINGIYNFTTKGITINSTAQPFEIYPQTSDSPLYFTGTTLLNADFSLHQETNYTSLTLTNDVPSANNIYAPQLVTNKIGILGSETWIIGSGLRLETSPVGPLEGTAEMLPGKGIVYMSGANKKNFCYVKTWNVADNKANGGPVSETDNNVSADTSGCTDTSQGTRQGQNAVDQAKRACCAENYFVFDMDANNGKMVCCRASEVAPAPGAGTPGFDQPAP
jgi:hypothetical protein